MQALHYGVDAGSHPSPMLNQQLEPSNCSSNSLQHWPLPVPGTDPVGMLQPMWADEEAQGQTESPLISDGESVPVTILSTEVNAQTTCTITRFFTGCFRTLYSGVLLSANFQGS